MGSPRLTILHIRALSIIRALNGEVRQTGLQWILSDLLRKTDHEVTVILSDLEATGDIVVDRGWIKAA